MALVRRALATDAAIIAEYNRRMALETEAKILDPVVLRAGVAAQLEDPSRGIYFIAEEADSVVGQAAITFEWSDWRNGWWWWLQSVYVRPESRRRGIFRALFEHIRDVADRDATVVGLRLYVEKDNHSAQATYQSLGMEEIPFRLYQR